MNRISFQWRITLMTAVLIAGACICLNLLLYRSGATGMDNLNGYVLQYQQNDDENLMIEIPDDQMSDFLIQFSQEVYDAKAVFGRKGWCITAAVTLLSAAIAYFVSGKALEPLKKLAQQAERIDQDSLVEVRLEENTIPEFRDLSQSVNRMLDRLAQAYRACPALENLLLSSDFAPVLAQYQSDWRDVVATAAQCGVAVPAFSASLSYYDGLCDPAGPLNLLQAQRDCFGAHTFRRIDRDGSFHHNW